jgi:hypothetical protein
MNDSEMAVLVPLRSLTLQLRVPLVKHQKRLQALKMLSIILY